jgi:hypothetical protein
MILQSLPAELLGLLVYTTMFGCLTFSHIHPALLYSFNLHFFWGTDIDIYGDTLGEKENLMSNVVEVLKRSPKNFTLTKTLCFKPHFCQSSSTVT